MSYFEKLEKLVEQRRLSLLLVIAPPRTGSSLLEQVFSRSESIDLACHEPFLSARLNTFNPDDCYKEIYRTAGGDEFFNGLGKRTVVVKEMSQWLAKNREYKRLFSLTNLPIVFLIRNPLLSVESRIDRVVSSIHLRANLSLQRHLLDELSLHNGFSSWESLVNVFSTSSLSSFFSKDVSSMDNNAYGEISHDLLKSLLELKARRHNYNSWSALVSEFVHERRDFAIFETMLLSNKRRARLDSVEFLKLEEQVQYAESNSVDFLVLDSTDVRLEPEQMIKKICSELSIEYRPRMIEWENDDVTFLSSQSGEHETLWYGELSESTGILPPTEIPIYVDRFPVNAQQCLLDINIPIFRHLSKRKLQLDDLINKEISVPNLEFATKALDPNHRKLIYSAVGENGSLHIKYIDPIYFVMNGGEVESDAKLSNILEFYPEIKLNE